MSKLSRILEAITWLLEAIKQAIVSIKISLFKKADKKAEESGDTSEIEDKLNHL